MIVVTRDLDFGAILAASRACVPSVVLVRGYGQAVDSLLQTMLAAIAQEREALIRGALLVVGPQGSRVRLLPLVIGD